MAKDAGIEMVWEMGVDPFVAVIKDAMAELTAWLEAHPDFLKDDPLSAVHYQKAGYPFGKSIRGLKKWRKKRQG